MLLEFGARNFASFKDGFQVNLRAKGEDNPATRLMAIKGANASGKTTVLKVISFLSTFVHNSFEFAPGRDISINSFFNNDEPISFYAIYIHNKDEYKYEVDLTRNKIINESIYKKDKLIIERIGNKITDNTSKEFEELKTMTIKDVSSFVSTAYQYGLKSINTIYNLFHNLVTNVAADGLMNEFVDYKLASELYHNDKQLLNFLKDVLINIDTGISDIQIQENINDETKEKYYFPVFYYDINEEKKPLLYHDQSSGTKALFKQLCAYKTILNTGGVLVIDELDINYHPDLVPVLLNFFESKKYNPNNAQLLFTTHNTEIMDRLKKYRIVLVNKEDNESFLYRLDEAGEILRNDRSVSKIYNSGRLGGKPKIELDYE